jgi:hypothetical protein
MMKKIIVIALLLMTGVSFGQFTFFTLEGQPIADGAVFTYNTFADNDSKLRFRVTNTSANSLEIKIQAIAITGGNGTAFELCYAGTCNDNIALNGIYPDYEYPLGPGQNNGNFDHFVNNNALGGNPADFVFSIYAIGFESQAIVFTYRYAPDLNVPTLEKGKVQLVLEQTQVSNTLSFETKEAGTATIINLNGQVVTGSFGFEAGINQHNLASLSSGVYFVKATYTNGTTEVVKFIKK